MLISNLRSGTRCSIYYIDGWMDGWIDGWIDREIDRYITIIRQIDRYSITSSFYHTKKIFTNCSLNTWHIITP